MRLASLFLLPLFLVGISFSQSTDFSVGPQYLITSPEPQFLRPIATPSLSLNAPLKPLPELPAVGPTVTNQAYASNLELQHQADLLPIYYGYEPIVDVELVSTAPTQELPPSINNTGFLNVPSAQSLRSLGVGLTLAQAAAYSKAHKRPTTHVYTNEDLQRLKPL